MQKTTTLENLRLVAFILFIGLLSFTLLSLPALFADTGDFNTIGEKPTEPTRTRASMTSTRVIPTQNNTSPSFNFIGIILTILLILLGIYVVTHFSLKRVNKTNTPEFKTKEERLRFSRDEATRILKEALESGKYSEGIVNAYHALDEALDGFRGAERPKHWTPKEYAIFVSPPVFQPTVYKIVEIFYNVRYGMQGGLREEVEAFLDLLFKLFENEVSGSEKERMISAFKELNLRKEIYQIQIFSDLTKPKGGVVR